MIVIIVLYILKINIKKCNKYIMLIYDNIKKITNKKDNKYITFLISCLNKYSLITFLEYLLIKINIKQSDDLFNLKYSNKIKYYKNDKKINY